jgi:hypothetical protein
MTIGFDVIIIYRLGLAAAAPVATLRTLTSSRSWYQFIDPRGMNWLAKEPSCN